MAVFYFTKQPDEQEVASFDFATDRFNGTEAAASQATSSINVETGDDSTAEIIDSSSQTAGVVTIVVKAGTDGDSHKITTLMTTDEANVYEQDAVMEVRAL